MFFGSLPLMVVTRLPFVVAMRCFDMTMFLTLMEPGMKLFTPRKESCNEDACRHPKRDDGANRFHLLKKDLMHLRAHRNFFIPE